ncbi:MAG: ATP-binding cassette domain-containing protein, partial [Clostridia bacterium]|nr:ATP-binding cassette domain-containing protein [Clostridia bacterium]
MRDNLFDGDMQVRGFNVSYYGYGDVVRNVSFDLPEGGVMCLLGAEGSGKTTLLRGLAGMEVSSGEFCIGGENITNLPVKNRNITYTFNLSSLKDRKTVQDNVLYPLTLRGESRDYCAERLEKVCALIGIKDILGERVKDLYPMHKALTVLARAFIRESNLYLIDSLPDELTYSERTKVFERFARAARASGGRVIYATQRPYEAYLLPDKVGVMQEGIMLQCAPMSTLRDMPKHSSVAKIAGFEDIKYVAAEAKCDGGKWTAAFCGIEIAIPEIKDKIYDGQFVVLGVKADDIVIGGNISCVVKRIYDDGVTRLAIADTGSGTLA